MSEESQDKAENFRRQRRFLFIMSMTLLGFHMLGVVPKDEAEYSGFALQITRPYTLEVGLWVVWAWALWRYIQVAFLHWETTRRALVLDALHEMLALVMRRARQLAQELIAARESGLPLDARADDNVIVETSGSSGTSGGGQWQSVPEYFPLFHGDRRPITCNVPVSWLDSTEPAQPVWRTHVVSVKVALHGRTHKMLVTAAFLAASLRRLAFSEFLVPSLFALFAAGYAIANPVPREGVADSNASTPASTLCTAIICKHWTQQKKGLNP